MITTNDTVLITGCGGMLGEGVYKRFKDHVKVFATDIDLNEPWLTHLDVRDATEVEKRLDEIRPDYIVHLAALTDMEYCETHPEDAQATNADAVAHFAPYVEKNATPFAYICTAGIFDGEKEVYQEDDIPNPLSVYGKTKYSGELNAKKYQKHVVARAGWMMGGGPTKDKKFINKLIKQVKGGAKELFVVDDKLGTPCYTYDLANILYTLLDKGHHGVFHGVCEGGGSRAEIARFLLQCLGREDVKITEVASDYFKTTYFAPRPRSEKMINKHLHDLGLNLTRDWHDAVEDYARTFDWGV
ncbi:MAG: SDR family oxidoreductase [Patescibacteria group bacterium]